MSEISRLLDGSLTAGEFLAANSACLVEYRRALQERGSTVPIRVQDDIALLVTLRHVANLCRLFVDGRIGGVELAYLADALQLSPNTMFAAGVADYVAEFTDAELHGPFSKARAKQVIEEIP